MSIKYADGCEGPSQAKAISQGWLVAVPSLKLLAGPWRRGNSQRQRDVSGFSEVEWWASPGSAVPRGAGRGSSVH